MGWYANDITRGTPQANVGVPDGLVLRSCGNGDMIQEATHITPLKGEDVLPQSWRKAWIRPTIIYHQPKWSYLSPVFDQQSICFSNTKLPMEDGVQYSTGGGTILLK